MQQFPYMDNVMLLLLSSIIISVVFGWISLKIAPIIGLMDIPGSAEHKNHDNEVPLTGGVILVDTMFVLMLLTGIWSDPVISSILLSGLIICLFGLADDYFNLAPIIKLFGHIQNSGCKLKICCNFKSVV